MRKIKQINIPEAKKNILLDIVNTSHEVGLDVHGNRMSLVYNKIKHISEIPLDHRTKTIIRSLGGSCNNLLVNKNTESFLLENLSIDEFENFNESSENYCLLTNSYFSFNKSDGGIVYLFFVRHNYRLLDIFMILTDDIAIKNFI